MAFALLGEGIAQRLAGLDFRRGHRINRLFAAALSHRVELLAQWLGQVVSRWRRARTTLGRRHVWRHFRRWGFSKAVAQAHQVGVAAFTHSAISAVGAGAVVQTPHQRPLRLHQCLHFEGQVVEEVLVAASEGLFVQAVVGQHADALNDAEAEPRLEPCPQRQATGELPEGLWWQGGIGIGVVVRPAPLPVGGVQQCVGIEFQGQGAGVDQPLADVETPEVFGPHAAFEIKGIAKVGVDCLAVAPGGDGCWVGMPVRHRWDQRRAGHAAGRWHQHHRRCAPVAQPHRSRAAGCGSWAEADVAGQARQQASALGGG